MKLDKAAMLLTDAEMGQIWQEAQGSPSRAVAAEASAKMAWAIVDFLRAHGHGNSHFQWPANVVLEALLAAGIDRPEGQKEGDK